MHHCQRLCRDPEMLKALSQNFGHEEVMTTLSRYGRVATARQGEIIRGLKASNGDDDQEAIEKIRRLVGSG